ncbi:Protein ALP1-like [Vitis vinifera]|uniref:Protein ALP1-like n=1 Tax=Vitis vinifera TaxID=29760 RepID=A0A438EY95_VITVI|nr:Protein ALP1-like [Vitis vinifera]
MNDSTSNRKKRRRKDEGEGELGVVKEGKKRDLKEIITSLLLLEEQQKRDQEEFDRTLEEEKMVFEENHKKKTRAMMDYYSNLQDYYNEFDDMDRARRKRCNSASATTAAAAGAAGAASLEFSDSSVKPGSGARRLWVKDRSKAWWDECNKPEFPEEEFRKAFRMSRATFDMICDELNSVVAKEDTMLRAAIPVRQRVAVCIWRLATGEPLRLVSKKFGLGISTCHKLVLEVCSAIRTVLMPKYLQWPDEETLRRMKDEFESISGIPNVVGSMYTTHIPIIAPKISVAAYFNRRHTERNQKTSYSITVQGVVDPKGVFTDGVWIVGGSGYPLMDWVMVPYTQQNLTWTQHAFNEKIGEIQRVSREAFARLKARWCCLQKRTEVKLQDLPVVLGACCVLHNICELQNEEMDPELRINLIDDEMIPEIPLRSTTSMKARDAIAHNLLHHGLAGTAFL